MKKIFILLYILPFLSIGQNTIDRSKAPAGLAPKPNNFINPQSFTLPNGLKVYVVKNSKLPTVNVQMIVDMKLIGEGEKAGLRTIFGSLLRAGTKTKTKAELDEAIEELGGNIFASPSSMSAFCLKNNMPQLFSIFSDICLNPIFNEEELEKIKKRTISGLEANKDDADAIASDVTNVLMYGKNHPYGEIEKKETVEKVTRQDILNYYGKYWRPNITYLVFVGDITIEEAKKITEDNLSSWAKKDINFEQFNFPKTPEKTRIVVVDRPQAVQSVIRIFKPLDFPRNSPDFITNTILNAILGSSYNGRLFINLREKHGFTYGAYSQLQSDRFVGKFIASASVRNEKTDSAVQEFLYEFNRLDTQLVSAEELQNTKNYKSGEFARSFEQPENIANYYLNIERFGLPTNYYKNYITNLNKVTALQVEQSAQKYITPNSMTILIVGKAADFAESLKKYGDIEYVDIYGNPKKENAAADVKLKPEEVIANYLKVISPDKDISSVKDLTLVADMDFNGQKGVYEAFYIFPNDFVTKITFSGFEVMRESKVDEDYVSRQQGQDVPVDDDKKQDLQEQAAYFSELLYVDPKNEFRLKMNGVEDVDGTPCYAISITKKDQPKSICYYDTKTFLKVKETLFQKGQQQNAFYSNYKSIKGIMFPQKLELEVQPGLKIALNFTAIDWDNNLSKEILKK